MIHSGRATVTTAGTRVALASVRTPAAWVTVVADKDNTGYIYLGDITVQNNQGSTKQYIGHPLNKGDFANLRELGGPSYIDLKYVYIDADTSGDAVTFNYGVR